METFRVILFLLLFGSAIYVMITQPWRKRDDNVPDGEQKTAPDEEAMS